MPLLYLLAALKPMPSAHEALAHIFERTDMNVDSLAHHSPRSQFWGILNTIANSVQRRKVSLPRSPPAQCHKSVIMTLVLPVVTLGPLEIKVYELWTCVLAKENC